MASFLLGRPLAELYLGPDLVGRYKGTSPEWAPPRSISITSGTGYAGSVYTSSVAGQWTADGAAIAGAAGTTYTMTLANEGKLIRCSGSNGIKMWVPGDGGVSPAAVMDIRRGLTLSGAAVSSWASSFGSAVAAQATSAAQPSYSATALDGSPGLTFDGGDVLGGMSLPINPDVRSFIGMTIRNPASIPFASDTGGGYFICGDGASFFIARAGAPLSVVAPVSAGVGKLITSRFGISRVDSNWRVDGVNSPVTQSNTTAGYAASVGKMQIGKRESATNQTVGVISTFVVYDAFLSDDITLKAEGWVAHTLGRLERLAADHPYKTAAPMSQVAA